jgi:single-stranded-DNA-specific exonuclease
MKKYLVRETIPEDVNFSLGEYPELLRTLLFYRNVENADQAERFLNPDYEQDLHDPFLMRGMEEAVERILKAVKNKEKIVIYGDYDCDGIPGSVILHDFFKKINYDNFKNYIPHRQSEGYGLSISAVEQFAQEGTALLITVDCGITDIDEVARAGELGIDVVVTDHHLPLTDPKTEKQILPPAYVILNPKQENDTYPFGELSGSGVAFKLLQAMVGRAPREWDIGDGWEKWLLDMAGLATVADMVPLVGENRTLAYFGLKVLRKSPRPGLQQLLKKMRVRQKLLTEDDIGFMIAPRVNAASRIGDPFRAFDLLSTKDETDAGVLSEYLHHLNDQRKGLVASMIKEARHKLTQRIDEIKKQILVVGNPAWRPGLLGLAANVLMEEYCRPVFVWGRYESDVIKGSCRSDGSVSIVAMMAQVKKGILLDFGGHEFSGGFSILNEKIHILEPALLEAYEKVPKKEKDNDTVFIDKKMSLDEVNWDTYRQIEQLSPFGVGNDKPIFLFEDISIEQVFTFGKDNNHLRLVFRRSDGLRISAIGFFVGRDDFSHLLAAGERINLVAFLEKSMFRDTAELRLRIVDIF